MITDAAKKRAEEAQARRAEYEEEREFVKSNGICPHCAGDLSVAFVAVPFWKCERCGKAWS